MANLFFGKMLLGGGVGGGVGGGGVVVLIVFIVSLIHCKYFATFVKTPGYLTTHLGTVDENTPTTVAFPLILLIKLPGIK